MVGIERESRAGIRRQIVRGLIISDHERVLRSLGCADRCRSNPENCLTFFQGAGIVTLLFNNLTGMPEDSLCFASHCIATNGNRTASGPPVPLSCRPEASGMRGVVHGSSWDRAPQRLLDVRRLAVLRLQ